MNVITTPVHRDVVRYNQSCVLWLPYNEAVGSTEIHDEITLGQHLVAGAVTFNGISGTHGAFDVLNSAFTLPNLGNTKDFIAVLVADMTTGDKYTLGSGAASDDRISFQVGTTSAVADGTSTAAIADPQVITGTKAELIHSDRGNALGDGANFFQRYISATDVIVTGAGVAITGADEAIEIGATQTGTLGAVNAPVVYGLAIYLVDTIPAKTVLDDILEWCNTNWRTAAKALPTHLIS